jgi:hypothetical protein
VESNHEGLRECPPLKSTSVAGLRLGIDDEPVADTELSDALLARAGDLA